MTTSASAGELLALLDAHHITDRALLRARDRVRSESDDPRTLAALHKEMRRYFGGVAAESVSQLGALERRLDDLYQRQYNAQAERSVAQRRLEGARTVLAALDRTLQDAAR